MTKIKMQEPGFERDLGSKAVLASDRNALKAYRKQREERRLREARISRIEHDVAELKEGVSELLRLMKAKV